MSPTNIRIYLTESSDAKHYDPNNNELIHKNEFDQAVKLITEAIDKAKAEKDGPSRLREHRAITISGTRGSGKTSFLLSLKDRLKTDENAMVLDLVDPTMIEEKGHVFLNIIAVIADLVMKKLDLESLRADHVNDKKRQWKDRMTDLAAGIPSIDGIGKDNSEAWQDPEFILQTDLKAVMSARKLETNFDEFLRVSLNILGEKVFILFFDDIDVDPRKGFSVLETIRKYLATPRLITVISGDLRMYSSIIREKKWENMGEKILRYEGELLDKLDQINDRITELTGQYLLKVLPPRSRIHLTTLLEKLYVGSNLLIEVGDNKSSRDFTELTALYDKIFTSIGVNNDLQKEVYRSFMLELPLRSQIQFLSMHSLFEKGNIDSNERLSDVFLADLLEKEIDINLVNHTPKYLCSIILEMLLIDNTLNEVYQLQPTTTDESLNASLVFFWILLSRYIGRGNRYLIFDYFIKIAFVRNVLTVTPYWDEDAPAPNVSDLVDQADFLNDGVLRDGVSAMQTYLFGAVGDQNTFSRYAIRLMGKGRKGSVKLKNRFDAVFDKAPRLQQVLAYIPCFTGSFGYKSETRVFYSIYSLLGTIGELVKRFEITSVENRKDALKQGLYVLSQLRSYTIPDLKTSAPIAVLTEEDEGEETRGKGDDFDEELMPLIEDLKAWLDYPDGTENNDRFNVSAHLLGKMFTRFYYAMANIGDIAMRKRTPLGEILHYQVVAFYNAVLVEDCVENLTKSVVSINNTRLEEKVFIDNLEKVLISGETEKLKLSQWLLACPMLPPYLGKKSRELLERQLTRFCGKMSPKNMRGITITQLLNEVEMFQERSRSRPSSPATTSPAYRLVKSAVAPTQQEAGMLARNRQRKAALPSRKKTVGKVPVPVPKKVKTKK